VLAYENQCAVVAWATDGDVPVGGAVIVQAAATIEEAGGLALPACSRERGDGGCKIVYSACSEPVLIR